MSGFISLSCPACGAKLTITDDKDRFLCDYCNNEQLIDRTVQTVSQVSEDETVAQKPEVVRETPSELAMGRLEQEISEMEEALEEIGIPSSIGEVITSATYSFLFFFFFAGALFFVAWAAGKVDFAEGIELILMQFTLVVIGIGIFANALGELKKGAERISFCRADSEKRSRKLAQMSTTLAEMEKRQVAEFNKQAEKTSIELASEHAIRRVKTEIAGLQFKISNLDKPDSIPLIIVSTLFRVIFVALFAYWFLSWASSQTLPSIIAAQLPGDLILPTVFWWVLGISGFVFAILPLKIIEECIHKLNNHNFCLEEQKRLEDLLAPKFEELEKHQNTLSQLLV